MSLFVELTAKEMQRQKNTLNLIASENYPSPKVLQLSGSVWNNKYGEGYPGQRYYAGNQWTDVLETTVQNKALQVFQPKEQSWSIQKHYSVNVQVLSGSPANAMVFLAMLNPGDLVLSLDLKSGGHLSHLHQTSSWLKFFRLENYSLKKLADNSFDLDLDFYEYKLKTCRPKLTIIGASSYPRILDFPKLIALAHQYGSLVLADIAHISGLVASSLHPTPFAPDEEGADFVTTTTHKTFRGPRGALLFCKQKFREVVMKTVFPGTSGGPHFSQIASVGQACVEILGEDQYPDQRDFTSYIQQVLINTKALETALLNSGLQVVTPTENHLCLIKLPENIDSLEIQQKLESVGIITNRNVIPEDQKSAWRPSGLRLGTAALTSRGLTENMARRLGQVIADLILDRIQTFDIQEFLENLNWWYDS